VWIRQVYLVEAHYLAMLLFGPYSQHSHEGGVAKIIHICMYTYIHIHVHTCVHMCVYYSCVCACALENKIIFFLLLSSIYRESCRLAYEQLEVMTM